MMDKVVNKDSTPTRESFNELLVQLAKNIVGMVRDEIEIVIREIQERMKTVRGGVLIITAGGVICFVAIMSLCAALIIRLTSYMSPVIAALVTGAGFALIGFSIAFIGYRQLKKSIHKT